MNKKEAREFWRKFFQKEKCPRCGKDTLWKWKDADDNEFYWCDYCNRDFEHDEGLGWFMHGADGRLRYYPRPNPKAKPLSKDAGEEDD